LASFDWAGMFHFVWSDGYNGQFKFAKAWYFGAQYPSLTISNNLPNGCEMVWNFFATCHAKREVDGTRALRKKCKKSKSNLKGKSYKMQRRFLASCSQRQINTMLPMQMHGDESTNSSRM